MQELYFLMDKKSLLYAQVLECKAGANQRIQSLTEFNNQNSFKPTSLYLHSFCFVLYRESVKRILQWSCKSQVIAVNPYVSID